MDLIIVALISTAGFLTGLVYLDKSFYRRLQWRKDYEMEMLKLKQKLSTKNKKLANQLKTTAPKGTIRGVMDWINILKDLNPEAISALINLMPSSELEEIEEEGSDLVSIIASYADKNPDIVKSFIDGISSKSVKDPEMPKNY